MKIGDEKYNYSLHEIAERIKEQKPNYVLKKLREKYANIESDIPGALIGYKRTEKISADHPEKDVLISLHNKYNRMSNFNLYILTIYFLKE